MRAERPRAICRSRHGVAALADMNEKNMTPPKLSVLGMRMLHRELRHAPEAYTALARTRR